MAVMFSQIYRRFSTKRNRLLRFAYIAVLLVCLSFALVNVSLRADPGTKAVAFEPLFDQLAVEGKVCFVFEGAPLHAEIDDATLHIALKGVKSLEERIEITANAFDYVPERLNARIFLMRKRYSSLEDLPCITYGEMLAFIRGCNRLTLALQQEDTMSSLDAASLRFASSLTKQQMNEIQSNDGLPIRYFSPAQQELIRKSAFQYYGGYRFKSIAITMSGLEALQSKNTEFKWINFQGETLFGCEGPFGLNRIKWSFPLSGHYLQDPIGAVLDTKSVHMTMGGKPVPPLPLDPTAPTANDYYEYAHPIHYDSATTFAKALNGIAACDTALNDKPICLVGKEYLPKSEYPLALSRLYRLLLIRQRDGSQRVAIRAPRFSPNLARLPDDLRLLIPDPLLRSAKISDTNPNHPAHADSFPSYYKQVVRRLRVRVLPRVPTPSSKPIPATDLTDEERQIFALTLVTGGRLEHIESIMSSKVPECLLNPEGIYVRAQISPNGEMRSIDIGHRDDKTGEFIFDVGGGMPKMHLFK